MAECTDQHLSCSNPTRCQALATARGVQFGFFDVAQVPALPVVALTWVAASLFPKGSEKVLTPLGHVLPYLAPVALVYGAYRLGRRHRKGKASR